MAKDPAVLWYWNDFHGGTVTLSRHLKGCYMDLLYAQFNSGRLSLAQIKTVLGVDFGTSWPILQAKFTKDENDRYYNQRAEDEKLKRQKFVQSRHDSLDINNGDMVYIYILFDPDSKNYKIGSSKNPLVRLRDAQKKNPDVKLFWKSEDLHERINEKHLRDKFSEKRKYWDWFRLTPDDIQSLKEFLRTATRTNPRTENENENENDTAIVVKIGESGESVKGVFTDLIDKQIELTDLQIGKTIEFIRLLSKITLTKNEVADHWDAFKINQFYKHEWYASFEDVVSHFRNSLKIEKQKNGKHPSSAVGKTIEFDRP